MIRHIFQHGVRVDAEGVFPSTHQCVFLQHTVCCSKRQPLILHTRNMLCYFNTSRCWSNRTRLIEHVCCVLFLTHHFWQCMHASNQLTYKIYASSVCTGFEFSTTLSGLDDIYVHAQSFIYLTRPHASYTKVDTRASVAVECLYTLERQH